MNIRRLVEGGFSELLLALLFTLFTVFGLQHPSGLIYLAVGFAILAFASALYSFQLRRQQISLKRAQGQRYKGGELQAMPRIKEDISSMKAGDTVTVCGTGATAIAYIADEVYEALRRGVNFEVYLIHPTDFLVDRLSAMEPDFEQRVFTPIVHQLRTAHAVRARLGADWTDKTLEFLTHDSKLCGLPHKETTCSSHGRMICTSAEIWKRVAERVLRNDPGVHSGQLIVHSYRRIPFIKAWRFRRSNGEAWYYVADYLYYPGVGIDNPIRRVEKQTQLDQHDTDAPGFINTDRINAHLDSIDSDSTVWEMKPHEGPGEPGAAPESKEEQTVSRKPDKPSSSRSGIGSAEPISNKSRKATP
ncbi:MAG: hypothetical protein QOH70_4 [Blastocatellia bacterium]|jgi:hypothetical protein|nr:hypothetical protein [Blastocatellia bacterium]